MTNNANINWSSEQVAIFDFLKSGRGHMIVRARAGTGKTTTIVNGIGFAKERKILLVAFNKSIAEELTKRVKNPNAVAKTLHSLGFSYILRSGWGKHPQLGSKVQVNTDRGRQIAAEVVGSKDSPKLRPVASAVAKLASLAKGAMPFGNAGQLADLAYSHGIEVDSRDADVANKYPVEEVARLARRAMDLALVETGEIDFDDMVFVTVVKKLARAEFGLVVVDEAQDMNAAQLLLAQAVCVKGGRIMVVGDDRQAIYAFRGADSNSLDRLKTELGASELGLKITRRCPKQVVALAAGLVPDFEAAPEAPEGEVVALDASKLFETAGPGDFILSRTNAPLVKVCFGLLRARKRAKIAGRDIGASLLAIVNKLGNGDLTAFRAALKQWAIRERAKAEGKKESVAEAIVSRVDDQEDMLSLFADESGSVEEMKRLIEDLFDDADPSKAPFTVCSSVHKAKGLEADRVFMLTDTFYKGPDFNEEQNIEYVAITRAKRTLYTVPNFTKKEQE